jgi:hypothetical protein
LHLVGFGPLHVMIPNAQSLKIIGVLDDLSLGSGKSLSSCLSLELAILRYRVKRMSNRQRSKAGFGVVPSLLTLTLHLALAVHYSSPVLQH